MSSIFASREYELRERNPVATDNYLISIFDILSAGGYFYLEPRTLQVSDLPVRSARNDRDALWYFLKRKAPNRTPPKPEFRASCF